MSLTHRFIPLSLILFAGTALADDLEQRLAASEARLTALEQQNNVAERVRINGFMTFAMQRTNSIRGIENPVLAPVPGQRITFNDTGTDWDLRQLTRAGVRISADINERTAAVVQFLARGDDDFNTEVQWAYLAYNISPDLVWRAGRLVLPTFMHSQYTQASYAYPWVVLPSEVYDTLPVDTMEGMDLTWKFSTGNIRHSANVSWGSTDVTSANGRYLVRNQAGANLTSYFGNLSTRISYSTGQTTLDLPATTPVGDLSSFSLEDQFSYFTSVGAQYDNGRWLLMAEITRLGVDTPSSWFPTQTAGYLTAGRRFGRLMPHLTWTMVEDEDNANCTGTANDIGCLSLAAENGAHSKSWTLGARYDLAAGIALKAEASRFYDFTDRDSVNAQLFSGLPTSDDPMVFRMSVDAAF